MPIFRQRLTTRFPNSGDRRLGLLQTALQYAEFLLLFDQELHHFEISELRAQLLLHQGLADVDARLDDRNDGLELVDGYRCRGLLGFLLRLLTEERGDLGAMLGHLVLQELTLGSDQFRICIGRRREISRGIIPAGKRGAQPRDVEPLGEEVVAQVIAFRLVDGRIELDQDVAGVDRLPILYPYGAHDPGLERLDDLDPTARQDFSARRRNDVDRAPPGPDQRRAEQEDDGGANRAANRRRRRFDDFKRRRQKGQLFGAPLLLRAPKRDNALRGNGGQRPFNRLHGALPATGATMHNGRRS